MKKILLTFLALAVLSLNSVAKAAPEPEAKTETKVENTLFINGLVLDNATNETLAGAVISVDGQTIYSDLEGNFILTNVKPGKIKVKVSMISYVDQFLEIDTHNASELNVKLKQL